MVRNELVHKNAVTCVDAACSRSIGSCENSEADNLFLELKSFNCLKNGVLGGFASMARLLTTTTARLASKRCFLFLSYFREMGGVQNLRGEWVLNTFSKRKKECVFIGSKNNGR